MELRCFVVLFVVKKKEKKKKKDRKTDTDVSFVNCSSEILWSARKTPTLNPGPTTASAPRNHGAAGGHWSHGGTGQRPALSDCWGRSGLYSPHHRHLHPLLPMEGLV